MTEFTPRLWQLFRFLGNRERMNVFRAICLAPDDTGMNVNTVTRMVNLHQSTTSIYLKQLASCGLLVAHRSKRFLFYHIQKEPRTDGADIIARELCQWFINEARNHHDWGPTCPPMPFFENLSAFANRLRVIVLRSLAEHATGTVETIFRDTRIPEDCCLYHLDLLVQHGLATQDTNSRYCFREPTTALGRLFTRLSISDITQ